MSARPILVFDTSALNKFAKESDSTAVFAGILSGYDVQIPGLAVEEFAATPGLELRRSLFQVCRRLLAGGHSIVAESPATILEMLITRHVENMALFEWTAIPVKSGRLEEGVYNDALILDEALAKQQRTEMLSTQKEFEKIYERQRAEVEELFKRGTEQRPLKFDDHLALIQMSGGAFWRFVGDYYESDAKFLPDENALRQFMDACPPFRALFLALALKWYDKCIRHLQTPSTFKIKRNDLMMSVYLPYCDQFITADEGQEDSLKQVAVASSLSVQVRSYNDFCAAFGVGTRPLG